MDGKRWHRIQSILEAALKLPPGEQTEFVAGACGDDSDLRHEVTSLLAADPEKVAFIEHSVRDFSDFSGRNPVGRVIGSYKIVRELGSGGMGTVFLATHEYQKNVAIKILKWGLGSEHFVSRFDRERQILSRLKHPNIGMLFDGGTTQEGLPYFVMEYVEGEPIHDYCDRHKLTVRQRLVLFQKVCAAVSFAHRNLIVHRDIKPGNIMVTPEGEPKLLDFGIAKLLGPGETGPNPQTMTVHRLMTPEYASPEQVEGNAVTTASDVYSLGVLLYELLTGHRPYRFTTRSEGEIRRLICEQTPRKPSFAVQTTETVTLPDGGELRLTPESVSRGRGVDPAKLKGSIAGDIDNIVMMALRKEPGERYSSVEAFAGDIDQYLKGYPVRARKETFLYVAAKFVRRNRLSVATAAMALLLGFGFTLAILMQQKQMRQERDKAERVAEFMMDIFRVADPDQVQGEQVTARELMDNAARNIRSELDDQPRLKATLLEVMGEAYGNIGLFDSAGSILQEALALRRDAVGERHPEYAKSLVGLGSWALKKGDFSDAETYYQQALALRQSLFGKNGRELVEVYCGLGDVAHWLGQYEPSLAYFDKAKAITESTATPDYAALHTIFNSLAQVHYRQGKYDETEDAYLLAAEAAEQAFGTNHTAHALALDNLGILYRRQAKYEAARKLFERAFETRKKVYQQDHPAIAASCNNLALLYFRQMKYEQAIPLFQEALEIRRKTLGSGAYDVSSSLNNLGLVYEKQGRLELAEPLYREALDIRIKILGAGHTKVAGTMNNLGFLYIMQRRFDKAEPLFRQALDIREKAFGANHPGVARVLDNLGDLRTRQGLLVEAESLYRRVVEINAVALGDQHPEYAYNLNNLGKVLHLGKKFDEALETLQKALAIRQKSQEPDHPEIGKNLYDLALLHLERGEHALAKDYCNKVLAGAWSDPATRWELERDGLDLIKILNPRGAESDRVSGVFAGKANGTRNQ